MPRQFPIIWPLHCRWNELYAIHFREEKRMIACEYHRDKISDKVTSELL
jgi:hypothetical protein